MQAQRLSAVSPLYRMPSRSILRVQKIQPVTHGPERTFITSAANDKNEPNLTSCGGAAIVCLACGETKWRHRVERKSGCCCEG